MDSDSVFPKHSNVSTFLKKNPHVQFRKFRVTRDVSLFPYPASTFISNTSLCLFFFQTICRTPIPLFIATTISVVTQVSLILICLIFLFVFYILAPYNS